MPPLKPKVFQDIKLEHDSVFTPQKECINLGYRKVWRLPLSAACKLAVVFVATAYLLFSSVLAPTDTLAKTAAEERQELEAQLQQLEAQMDEYEQQITSYQKQGKSLKGEISQLNGKIAKLNTQIKLLTATLHQLDGKIGETEEKIVVTESNIARNQEILAGLVRDLYRSDRANLMEIFLKHAQLSEFFGDINSKVLLQGNLRLAIDQIINERDVLKDNKQELALARADAEEIKRYQDAQKQQTLQVQDQKSKLLAVTKGEETRYQTLLKQTKETASQIRSRIFELLGGGQMTFAQAYNYAKLASEATGVRPALILAVLDRESALGKNVGRCSYQNAMSPSNQETFLKLMAELKLDPSGVTVSCPNADGVYGGAMGPAQFVPNTWELYRSKIAKITGHTPPSPWNNADAFVATALYLRDAGAAGGTVNQERIAAAKYYAGGNYRRYLWTYGEAVVSRAAKFQQDIETIASN